MSHLQKFKKGDRVIAIKNYGGDFITKGDTFIVTGYSPSLLFLRLAPIRTVDKKYWGSKNLIQTGLSVVEIFEIDTVSQTKLYKALN